MRWVFSGLVLIRGLHHFIGFAKGLGFAEAAQLTQPVSKMMGFLWLAADLLLPAAPNSPGNPGRHRSAITGISEIARFSPGVKAAGIHLRANIPPLS